MVHLATHPRGKRISITALAQDASAPKSFLSKVMQRLVTSRLVNSHRGATGGFELALPPGDITMLDVVTAVEGPLCLNACLPGGEGCDRRAWCAAHHVWAEAQAKMAEILDAATLETLATESNRWLALAKANGEFEWP